MSDVLRMTANMFQAEKTAESTRLSVFWTMKLGYSVHIAWIVTHKCHPGLGTARSAVGVVQCVDDDSWRR